MAVGSLLTGEGAEGGEEGEGGAREACLRELAPLFRKNFFRDFRWKRTVMSVLTGGDAKGGGEESEGGAGAGAQRAFSRELASLS